MGACELDIIIPISAKVKRRRGEEGKAGEMAHDMETRAKHVYLRRFGGTRTRTLLLSLESCNRRETWFTNKSDGDITELTIICTGVLH